LNMQECALDPSECQRIATADVDVIFSISQHVVTSHFNHLNNVILAHLTKSRLRMKFIDITYT